MLQLLPGKRSRAHAPRPSRRGLALTGSLDQESAAEPEEHYLGFVGIPNPPDGYQASPRPAAEPPAAARHRCSVCWMLLLLLLPPPLLLRERASSVARHTCTLQPPEHECTRRCSHALRASAHALLLLGRRRWEPPRTRGRPSTTTSKTSISACE